MADSVHPVVIAVTESTKCDLMHCIGSGAYAGSKPIELYFSNPDLLWANEHTRPRFGQGAFAQALEALHRELTGSPLPNAKWFGKPNPEPYRYRYGIPMLQAALVYVTLVVGAW